MASSPTDIRRLAISRARKSMSARLCAARSRSCSMPTRSRASCRFWASRISGAAYEACSDSIRVRKMNGYSSNRGRGGPNGMFQSTQR